VYADRYDAGRGAGYDRHRMAALTTAATAATDMPSGRSVALWVLLGFLGSWLFIRTSARLMRSPNVTWWPGSVKTSGGLHIHHLVWGIGLMVVCGFLGFALEPSTPRSQIIGSLFGIGVGFTLDEFALWLRLQDVYWSEQGRASIDVVVLAAILGTLAVINSGPLFKGAWWEIVIFVALDLALMVVGLAKGKTTLAIIGLLIPVPIGMIAAIRLAKPDSRWARWRYENKPRKLAKARKRNERWEGRRIRFQNAIAGAPDS
jgi:lysyl-tRNA synthetase class 2